jgi:DNA-binding transcriptional regulator PaaX
MDTRWLLLIYTVPAQPSRKRAAIWREVKKVGAEYLRDGVCILPERPDTLDSLRAIAASVDAFDGEATVVQAAELPRERAEAVVARFQATRADEYADVVREAERLLEHVARETEHRDFTYAEVEELEQDLAKLRRWADQVRARDYFGSHQAAAVTDVLERCESALGAFLERAAEAHTAAR